MTIQNGSVFKTFVVPELLKYCDYGQIVKYKAKTTFVDTDFKDKMLYVISGTLKVSITEDEEKEKVLFYAGEGSIMGLLFNEGPLDYHFYATNNVELCVFDEDQLFQMMREHQDAMMAVLKHYNAKVSYYMQQATELSLYTSTARVLSFFKRLCLDQGEQMGKNQYLIKTSISQKVIAEMTDVHFVTVSRIMKTLNERHILTKEKGRIIIHDYEALEQSINLANLDQF